LPLAFGCSRRASYGTLEASLTIIDLEIYK
jgi:hypothetical protein